MTDTATKVETPTPADALVAFRKAMEQMQAAGLMVDGKVVDEATLAQKLSPPKVARKSPRTDGKKYAPDTVGEFIAWFIRSDEKELYSVKHGQWECKRSTGKEAHLLIFHSKLLDNDKKETGSFVICIRPIGSSITIFNASRITYGTAHKAQKMPQEVAEKAGAVPVPFENVASAKRGAGLDLKTLKVVDWAGSEKMIIPPVARTRQWASPFYVINRHFAGATLVQVGSKYFLFDADREEVKWHGFNPFFTELPRSASSVIDAYAVLAPTAVHAARLKGTEVIRQGEFFFVKVGHDEVYQALLGEKDAVTKFFFDQLTERLIDLGCAVVNCANNTRGKQIRDFLETCRKSNAGKLPESEGINANEVLSKCLAELNKRVGSPAAQTIPDPSTITDEYQRSRAEARISGESHSHTHMSYLYDELRTRLATQGGFQVRNGRSLGTDDGSDSRYGIRFEQAIGVTDDRGGAIRGNRHRSTGMLTSAKDAKIVYAIGAVLHEGREHHPILLKGWYRVYPNTATNNWTVSGDVD